MAYIKELEIGYVKLSNNILLAPMAGVTDLPFRIMCKKYGNPGLVYTEMVSSRGIYYEDGKTGRLLNTEGEDRPITFQIFGSTPEVMAKAAKEIENEADIIDINMGCPAPKIVKNGDGSRLLQNLDLAGEIVRAVVDAVDKPV
ncbi:MAG: tRNA-dihydrouridine synthase, partial [Oscillospiraceae bacterium]|nr:tRNA-dihydrouridine synthase [Oscillospiraceae bacterium]